MIFLTALLEKLLDRLPWIAKVPFYIGMALIWLVVWAFNFGLEVPTKAQEWFDGNYERKSVSLLSEIKELREDVKETKEDTRDIKNHLMGRSKDHK